ncbi:endoplasmic reticulum-Golgi intermediate compartment protein [Artemisia annua]|uniref:Endoplasmic reticulum-Golgi intermediate compartment protein n=1 Tax=Artemisia annua TaxID=35608 RepID=A0A2U1NUY9_ARTAN|nr:endoplasmic reticulum-Golgi intermediate compartment protein [Artemisia annua]
MSSGMMNRVFSRVRNLDAYPKVNEDFYRRTLSGGVITLISSIAMICLVFSEIGLYLHTVTESKLVVDTSRGEKLQIHFDITFPAVSCTLLSLDAIDISGEQHLDIKHAIMKNRIDQNGHVIQVRMDNIGTPKMGKPLQKHGGEVTLNETYCGSCYGAEMSQHECCNSCDEVREAYRRRGWGLMNPDSIDQCKREGFVQRIKAEEGEGCNLHGSLEVNKVAGNFHFVKSFHLANMHGHHEANAFEDDSYNISHRINKLSFGDPYPGILNPLDGVHWNQVTANGMYQYFIKVVPTVYTPIRGSVIRSNQFSVTEHYKSQEVGQRTLPGVFFFYDLSAIKVTYTETHPSFLHFLTNLCAIVGGIFTVAGILDSFIYHGQRALKKKRDIGKLG